MLASFNIKRIIRFSFKSNDTHYSHKTNYKAEAPSKATCHSSLITIRSTATVDLYAWFTALSYPMSCIEKIHLNSVIPVKKENGEGKDKQKEQKKSSATAISLDCLR